MPKTAEAIITPEVLKWARITSGYREETIASKMKKDIEKIRKWENGDLRPTIAQLRVLANYYKRPLATFYLPTPPESVPELHDYRRISVKEETEEPVLLNQEIRKAFYRREVALDLSKDLSEPPPKFSYSLNTDSNPEEAGNYLRKILSIKIETQFSWGADSTGYTALNNWRTAIENLGVLVFQTNGVDLSTMRGFSISEYPLPVIGLNPKDHPKPRTFTLLHELTHLLLHRSGICDVLEGPNFRRMDNEEEIEVFCNHVAGSALVPSENLLRDEVVSQKTDYENWTDKELILIGQKFGASKEVILRRLLILGKTSDSFYKEKRTQFLKEYASISGKKMSGGPSPPVRVISTNGYHYTVLVLDSYGQGLITGKDLSDYLDTNIKHLNDIRNELGKKIEGFGVAI